MNRQLSRLSPFLDLKGIIRVGGHVRTPTRSMSSDPILLHKAHPWMDLPIDHYHRVHDHIEPTFTWNQLSLQFWILSARQRTRHRLFQRFLCFRARPRLIQPNWAIIL